MGWRAQIKVRGTNVENMVFSPQRAVVYPELLLMCLRAEDCPIFRTPTGPEWLAASDHGSITSSLATP